MSLATWEICLVQHISLSEYYRPPREALVCVGGGEGWGGGKQRASGSPLGPCTLNRAWHVVCAECMNGPAWGPDTQLCRGAFKADRILVRAKSKNHLAGGAGGGGGNRIGPIAH